jgi:hypothetical protein
MTWQPISSAPKDGTHILVWWPEQYHCPFVAHFADKWCNGYGWKWSGWGEVKEGEPTLWMPLSYPAIKVTTKSHWPEVEA